MANKRKRSNPGLHDTEMWGVLESIKEAEPRAYQAVPGDTVLPLLCQLGLVAEGRWRQTCYCGFVMDMPVYALTRAGYELIATAKRGTACH